ncbi:MAG: bifunctional diaminohydroxyphosphoribosylaminopyrimidine deaminase/5-amino-6-(5-phosphoribosylamino)uracil reductase RibD [Paludibacteraceae bacterium]|nr:bifunctional diaminohydroxyphosphoribosylaminopyrimidine deaminase/5-amino-6-(5-phosphoribosylamino)uracil reductase RibD [Paludibacteraceae bacterium]
MESAKLYISRCLQLARLGEYYVAPNPMVGAVLVHHTTNGDVILGEGWHMQYGAPHAEPNCIRNAEEAHPEGIDYKQCTLYVSLEPCSHYGKTPPCAELIIRKGIGHVVIGTLDPNPQVAGRGVRMMQEAGVEVTIGILETECRALNKRFFCLQEQHRPYVILKWAETADGYIDKQRGAELDKTELGSPLVISTPLIKLLVHQQRAQNMAIMVGTRTALLDNPRLLTTRWSGRHPIRITLDRHGILPADSQIFSDDAPTIVYRDNTNWSFILQDLAARNIHSVLVEGGSMLLQHIIDSDIYDEVHIEVSNQSIGSSSEPSHLVGVKAPHYIRTTQPKRVDNHLLYIEKH